jgi:hypothetical protein
MMKHPVKQLAFISLLLSNMFFAAQSMAEEVPPKPTVIPTAIPTAEQDFVKAIHGFDKAKIIAQFGEPAKAEDVKIKDTAKVVASIWHYHNINTAADGSFYQTTELDFIDDKVVMVVFMNHDGSESNDGGQRYELPENVTPEIQPQL